MELDAIDIAEIDARIAASGVREPLNNALLGIL